MIYLKPELAQDLDSAAGLKRSLQLAIELEHAALPPYMYALYSLSGNEEIHTILKSVLVDEMGHLALACNVLNAIGGTPVLDSPQFVPRYPSPLPGGVQGGLTVPLAPFSIELVRDVFMAIEEPDDPFVSFDPTGTGEPLTIGEFYAAIRDAIRAAGPSIFTGDPTRQVVGNPSGAVIAVTDVATATKALDTIVAQDSGTNGGPEDLDGRIAHYYRFDSIVHGRELMKDPHGGFTFTGQSIPFDPAGVIAQIENPTKASYQAEPDAANANDVFNASYTRLLNALQTAFTSTGSTVSGTIRKMFVVRGNAGTLASTQLSSGKFAGPTFDFQPEAPLF